MDEKKLDNMNNGRMAELAYEYFSGYLKEQRESIINLMVQSYDPSKTDVDFKCFAAELSSLYKLEIKIRKVITSSNEIIEEIYAN